MSSAASAHPRTEPDDQGERDLVVVISPFGEPAPHLVAAVGHAGGTGILDLGLDPARGREALTAAAAWSPVPFGVRVAEGCPLELAELPACVDTVVLGVDAPWGVAAVAAAGRRVLVEVLSVPAARQALDDGADGLIARGNEAGGRVGDLTTFTLLQYLIAAKSTRRDGTVAPVWAAGGIGPATAAAAVAGGAAGVVLDSQLALVREVELPAEVAKAVRAMDGSETALIDGHRVYVRPDLPVAGLVGWASASVSAIPSGTAGTGAVTDAGGAADEPEADYRDTGGERASDGALSVSAALSAPTDPTAPVALRLGGRDLREQLLPVGQDGAFAAGLADRHHTASAVVRAVRESIRSSLASAARHRPLAPGSAFAAARGLRHAVAQGPMTRVSDRARFALSVAREGGLPFLALALMSGKETRALLEETAALLGDLPWGVGILGFAPPETRAAQLDAVYAVRPPCALIAGGRPAQSAPLEAVGIDTFLHVPSPGLLDRFLADGARKFVFEGRECGGHVGPRASFPLWEAQIAGLLEFARRGDDGPESLRDLDVLFAGGIHDPASAAMVAAAAAPLVDRGARIGVLMGTAYLFTDEAVTDGAIMPGFQNAAITASRTVLLETSPGHATRCVESAYVHDFLRRRDELAAAGVPRKEMWAELEQLNLGRLRIASRGVRREGAQLVTVGPDEQAAEGMFMIGQVAGLRSARTSIARLHTEVTQDATAHLAARASEFVGAAVPGPAGPATATSATATGPVVRSSADDVADGGADGDRLARAARSVAAVRESARPLDIAIIGMSAVFPQAADDKDYWANVVAGVDAITEVSPERWNADFFYDSDSVVKDAGRRTPSKWGGFLPQIPFDALAYGIPPRSLRSIDPGQLLALEAASRALRDAGYEDRPFDRKRSSVVFGAESGSDLSTAYGFRSAYRSWVGELTAELEEILPDLDEDSFPGLLANVIAGRVANRLDLGGLNFTVDAACASSLAALDAACKELSAGSSDLVLCGGVDTHSSVHDFLLFASVHALSPGGRCRSFAAGADGTSLGEGVAVVVLKRLADAQRDGDRIRAVIRAVAGSSDGRALGLTAPRKAGQVIALERAYSSAGISPSEVGVLEAHATGTVVGDRTELATLTEVFKEHGAGAGQCAVGSVKSQIGHTKCAAGLAGLVKVARAVETGIRPPTLHVDRPNPYWDRSDSPFYFDDRARPWVAPAGARHAGLSAFGFGGTNFHVVVSAYDKAPEPAHGLDRWPAELFLVRGRDRETALRRLDRLDALARANDGAGRPYQLRDLARTVCEEAGGPVQIAFVADDLDALPGAITQAREPLSAPRAGVFVRGGDDGATVAAGIAPGPGTGAGAVPGGDGTAGSLAFVFPGQGSQRPGMLADLFVAFPRLRSLLELAPDVAATMFPPAAFTDDERAAQTAALTDTRAAQPALGLAALAVFELLAGLRIRPDHVAGHSYGELAALSAAGVIDREALVRLSRARADAILAAAGDDPGTMAAVSATADQIRAALGEPAADGTIAGVALANQNAPRQTVISGPSAAVDAAVERLKAAGLSSRRIPVACAFHSPVVAGAAHTLAAELDGTTLATNVIPVWSNTLAAPYPGTLAEIRAVLAGQVAAPVRFVEQIEAMYAAGVRVFVEAGPGRVLAQLIGKILAGRPHRVVVTDAPAENGLRRLLLAVAELAAAGVDVDPSPLFTGRDTRPAAAERMPRRPGWLLDGAYVRTSDGRQLPGGLLPARRIVPAAPVTATPAVLAGRAATVEAAGTAAAVAAAAVGDPAAVTNTVAQPGARGGTDSGAPAAHRHDLLEWPGTGLGESVGGSAVVDLRTVNGNGVAHPAAGPSPNGARAAVPPGTVPADSASAPDAPAAGAPAAAAPVAPAPGPADGLVLEFLRTGRELVAAQRDVLLTYLNAGRPVPASTAPAAAPAQLPLGTSRAWPEPNGHLSGTAAQDQAFAPAPRHADFGAAAVMSPPPAPVPAAGGPATSGLPADAPEADVSANGTGALHASPTVVVAAPAPTPAAQPVAGSVVRGMGEVTDAVVGVIADLTGYPVEMLEPDLDLEADLSIDSIKRTEILGELAGRVGLPGAGGGASELDESVVEELAAVKTVRGIATWIVERTSPGGSAVASSPVTGPVAEAVTAGMPAGVAGAVVVAAPAPTPAAQPVAGSVVRGMGEVTDAVVGVIADLTGYPVEMLEPDLDLEADLSIDSIKRTEILGELAGRVGLPGAGGGASELDESVVEELAAVKTVRGIATWIVEHSSQSAPDDGSGGGSAGGRGGGAGGGSGPAPRPGSYDLPEQGTGGGRVPADAGSRVLVPAGASASATAVLPTAHLPEPSVGPAPSIGRAGTAVLDSPRTRNAATAVQAPSAPESWGVLSTPRGATDPTFAARAGAVPAASVVPAADAVPAVAAVGAVGALGPQSRVPLRRFVVDHVELPALPSWDELVAAGTAVSLAAARFTVVEGGLGIGLALSTLLEQAGAHVRIVSADSVELDPVLGSDACADGLFWVASAEGVAGPGAGLPAAFAPLRAAALAGARRLVVVTGLGGDLGRGAEAVDTTPAGGSAAVGMAGLVRTLAQELPATRVRLVDVHPKAAPRRIAERLLAEMFDAAAPVVVGYRDDSRITPTLRPADLAPAGPPAPGAPRGGGAGGGGRT
ncbi:acyltransferase domain-containing protein, partial [Frankia sp. Cpl3]|nr:acyltransferase domain-containing protein [Frankia sp. Cpl3]